MAATYLINRLPSKILNNKSPYELLYHKPPDLQYLKVIGCQAYASIHTPDKFKKIAIPYILLGYPQHQKGYLLLAQNTKKVFVSRHVTFHEHIFPFHANTPYHTSLLDPTTSTLIFYPEPNTPLNSSTSPEPTPSTSTHPTSSSPPSTPTPSIIQDNHNSPNNTTTASSTTPKQHSSTTTPPTLTSTTNTTPSTTTSPPTNTLPPSPPPPLRKSQRTRTIPTKLKDFQHYQPSFTNSLTLFLIALGFSQSHADSSLFTYYKDKDALILRFYVDDILLLGNNTSMISEIKQKLYQTFDIKDLGPLHYYLRIEFLRNSKGLAMTQRNDWASCPSSRRLVFGFSISLGNSFISWHSKKQPVVFRSLTEAEYKALADCSCEITWLCFLLKDLNVIVPKPVRILCDNISTIALASNPIQHARTKHIEIDCHFVRDKIKAGQIITSYIPTTAQAADIFTKALTTYPFNQCLAKLGMCDPNKLPTCGGEAKVKSATMVHNREGNRDADTSKAHNNEIGRSSGIDDEVVLDPRQQDDNDLQDERQDQPKE
uniref:Homogeneously-staining region n=1 Tax=Tanacetum cinerariifolium TaxID=118510 RepID=A0A699HCL8_TANCI|nr:homogeneously-staining region [Tanacetum cinerariifolium]